MLEFWQTFMLVNAVCLVGTAIIAILDHLFYPPLPAGASAEHRHEQPRPRVTILIPARNEEANIEGCVLSAFNQTYPDLEVIVVDDNSTDRTGDLLRELAAVDDRLTVVEGQPLPEGWIGKGWALYQGHQKATGKWIMLLDADVRLEPWAVDQLVARAERQNIDFLNPYPYFVNVSFWEKVMQPLLWGIVRIRFPLIFVNQRLTRRNPAFAMAFGPCILVRKESYDAVGGHRHVAMDILEDVALAKLMRNRGYRTCVLNGKNLLRVRMYHNLRELMDGWGKTAYGAMGYNLPLMLAAVFGLTFAAAQPFATLAWGAITANQTWMSLGLFQVLGVMWRRILDHNENDFPLWTILLHPVAIMVVLYIQLRAVWQYYFGAYRWKDRQYHKPKPASTK